MPAAGPSPGDFRCAPSVTGLSKSAHGSGPAATSFPRQPGLVHLRPAVRYSSGVKSFSQSGHNHSYRGADFHLDGASSPFIQLRSNSLPGFGPPVFIGCPRAVTVRPPGSNQPGGGRPSPVLAALGPVAFANLRNEALVSTVDWF